MPLIWDHVLQEYDRCERILQQAQRSGARVAIFGAGVCGSQAAKYLTTHGYNVVCFFDNSPAKHGKSFLGLPCRAFEEGVCQGIDLILVAVKGFLPEIQEQIGSTVAHLSYDAWYVAKNFQEYAAALKYYDGDEKTRQTYYAILLGILSESDRYFQLVYERDQYFCLPQFVVPFRESFLDVGAYVGDMLEKFIWANCGAFKHYYAVEPNPRVVAAFEARRSRLLTEWAIAPELITLIQAAASDTSRKIPIYLSGDFQQSLGTPQEGDSAECIGQVQTITIDEEFAQRPVTFVKADIEGGELAMLQGARNVLAAQKPKLAISVYHKVTDLVEIVAFVKSVVPEYQVALRHHASDFSETVLYCWTK